MTREVANAFGKVFLTMTYEPQNNLTFNVWQGYLTLDSIMNGSNVGIDFLTQTRCPYLLNDNSQVVGPWFDSVDWLQRLWAPQAQRLGLRYVAHVLQPHTEDDLGLLLQHNPFAGKFELQFFTSLADATTWLRDCQRLDNQA